MRALLCHTHRDLVSFTNGIFDHHTTIWKSRTEALYGSL
jgi:hypothetical protein